MNLLNWNQLNTNRFYLAYDADEDATVVIETVGGYEQSVDIVRSPETEGVPAEEWEGWQFMEIPADVGQAWVDSVKEMNA